jgi:tetratricopeptide (TPR) repeat protein
MASQLTSYKIFVASPGGLEDERQTFRDVISAYNEAEANHRGAHFVPVGWEITLRGVGRAQEKINEEVRQCDFFVLLLWDRWGTPTGSTKKYTSGTEEEYAVAWECHKDSKKPMRELIVFFKAVTPRQLSDPGEQLRRVLDFKKTLESEKQIFFDTFDDKSAFAEKLRKYLGLWLRQHESGHNEKAKSPSLSAAERRSSVPDDFATINPKSHPQPPAKKSTARKAASLAKAGKITEAEALFTQAISRFDDPYAFSAYGEFLIEQHRWVQAESMFRDLVKVAEASKSPTWAAYAFSKLSAVYLVLKNPSAAVDALGRALEIYEALSDQRKVAFTVKRLAFLHLKNSQHDLAKSYSKRAQELFVQAEKWREAGDVTAYLAKAVLKLEGKTAACLISDKAIEFYEKGNEIGLVKNTIIWRDHLRSNKPGESESPAAS